MIVTTSWKISIYQIVHVKVSRSRGQSQGLKVKVYLGQGLKGFRSNCVSSWISWLDRAGRHRFKPYPTRYFLSVP